MLQIVAELGPAGALPAAPSAPEGPETGERFSDVFEKAVEGGEKAPQKQTRAMKQPEEEEGKGEAEAASPAETDVLPAELAVSVPELAVPTQAGTPENAMSAQIAPVGDRAHEAPSAPVSLALEAAQADVESAELQPAAQAGAENQAEGFLASITAAMEDRGALAAEREAQAAAAPEQAPFQAVRAARENTAAQTLRPAELEMNEEQAPQAAAVPTPEKTGAAAPEAMTGQGPQSGGQDENGGLSTAENSERRGNVTLDAQNAFAAFSPDSAPKADGAELVQAVDKAMARLMTDLRVVETEQTRVTIALEPEELGAVSITLLAEEGGVTARIITDNREAADLIAQQMDRYILGMADKGVKVERAEVVCNQFAAGDQSFDGRREPYDGKPAFTVLPVAKAAETEPVAELLTLYTSALPYGIEDEYTPRMVYQA